MKRFFFRAVFLALCLFAPISFFSCKSSAEAAKTASEGLAEQADNSLKKTDGENGEASLGENAQKIEESEALVYADSLPEEEKIPKSEVDELNALLQGGKEERRTDGQEGGIRRADGGLLEKISPAAAQANAQSQSLAAPEQGQRPAEAPAESASTSQEAVQSPRQDNPQTARGDAAAINKNDKNDESGGSGLSRRTSQGNDIQGGPLIGPGSNRANGRDANAPQGGQNVQGANGNARPSFGGQGARPSAQASSLDGGRDSAKTEEANEGIALIGPQDENEADEEAQEEKAEIVPSRSMSIRNKQFVDITYPGTGWIYLGEEDGGDHFIFQGRKLGNGETTFSLRSKSPGSALLHFYKNDILTGSYIDDYIQIDVSEKSASDSVHVAAPSYAEVVPPKFDRQKNKEENSKALAEAAAKKQAEREQKRESPASGQSPDTGAQSAAADSAQGQAKSAGQSEGSPSEKVQTVIQTSGQEKTEQKQRTSVAGTSAAPVAEAQAKTESAPAGQTAQANGTKAKSLLEQAQKAYDEKRYEDALDLVQQFFDAATEDFDAGLYLEGLILEAKSSVRNIKSAIGAYDTLIKNWPQSQYWRRANERSIYLKRFYMDIR